MGKVRKKISSILWLIALICCFYSFAGVAQTKVSNSQKEQTERQLAEIVEALNSNNLEVAEAVLLKVLTTSPKNSTAQTLAGIVADRKNDLPKAEKHFAAAARLDPLSPETRNNYGAILLKLNRRAEAAREFAASLKMNPNQPSALVNLGQIRFAEKNFAASRELFLKAKAISPDSEILRALVLISLQLNEKERIQQDFKEFAGFRKEVSAEKYDSNDTTLAESLLKSGWLPEAQEELEFLIAKNPAQINALLLLSKVFLEQKNIKAAGRTLESAVARGIEDAKIYAALADVYQAGGYLENAIPAMRLAIEKDPKNELYRVRYGLLLIDSKAPAAAIIRLEESLKEFPGSPKILLALGMAQQMDGKSVDAQKSFEKALKLAPQSVPVMAYLALILDEKGLYAETVAMTERALAIEEKNAILHYLLADTILKMPQADALRAEKHLKRAIELEPGLTQAHLALGRLLARENRWTEAAARFETAARLAPDLADAQYQLGRALARLKRMEESKLAFEKFKKLNENQTAQKEISRRELVQRLANIRF